MTLFTVRTALETARGILVPRTNDSVLSAQERAQCSENVNQIDLTLNVLRVDNTISTGQRAGRSSALKDRVTATLNIDSHFQGSPQLFYNALDLLWDTADCIAAGIPSFEVTL
jgi:hypothetical protein